MVQLLGLVWVSITWITSSKSSPRVTPPLPEQKKNIHYFCLKVWVLDLYFSFESKLIGPRGPTVQKQKSQTQTQSLICPWQKMWKNITWIICNCRVLMRNTINRKHLQNWEYLWVTGIKLNTLDCFLCFYLCILFRIPTKENSCCLFQLTLMWTKTLCGFFFLAHSLLHHLWRPLAIGSPGGIRCWSSCCCWCYFAPGGGGANVGSDLRPDAYTWRSTLGRGPSSSSWSSWGRTTWQVSSNQDETLNACQEVGRNACGQNLDLRFFIGWNGNAVDVKWRDSSRARRWQLLGEARIQANAAVCS